MPERSSGRSEVLTGWGRTAPSRAWVNDAASSELLAAVRGAGERGIIARGLGRSYGDAAQNAGGDVVHPVVTSIELDTSRPGDHRATVSAGTSLHTLIRELLPTGHFVPVTPGTRQVTVGGAIAADIHGKNHHRAGSFGDHVVSLELITGDGSVRTVGPDVEPELFWATVGGMGLTGVIARATVRVPEVETGWMSVHTERIDGLDALMSRMVEADRATTHSVAWIDTMASGRSLGRSVLTTGEHARLDEIGGRDRWRLPGSPRVGAPAFVPGGLISRPAIRAFNELWFRKAPRDRSDEIQDISAFFHPLDLIADWNRLYGPRGFVQYQFVVPDGAEETLIRVLSRFAAAGHPSFLSVLKRFGPGNQGLLSFPMQGWTLALDIPTSPDLMPLFAWVDEQVMAAGGRIYLAKDSRADAETVARMYPGLPALGEVRRRVDPAGVIQSDLSRRLGL